MTAALCSKSTNVPNGLWPKLLQPSPSAEISGPPPFASMIVRTEVSSTSRCCQRASDVDDLGVRRLSARLASDERDARLLGERVHACEVDRVLRLCLEMFAEARKVRIELGQVSEQRRIVHDAVPDQRLVELQQQPILPIPDDVLEVSAADVVSEQLERRVDQLGGVEVRGLADHVHLIVVHSEEWMVDGTHELGDLTGVAVEGDRVGLDHQLGVLEI